MDIDNLTIKEAREVAALFGGSRAEPTHPLTGKNVFIRTVTHAHLGLLVAATPTDYVLTRAVWVADTARFMQFVCEGRYEDAQGRKAEIEPFPADAQVFVNRGACVDMVEWRHDLPTEQR